MVTTTSGITAVFGDDQHDLKRHVPLALSQLRHDLSHRKHKVCEDAEEKGVRGDVDTHCERSLHEETISPSSCSSGAEQRDVQLGATELLLRNAWRTRIDQSCADELDRDTLRAEPLAVVGQTMKQRRLTTWLAGSLWATWFALVAMLVLIGTDPSRPLLAVAATFGMVTVGALVASRQPANPIGWVFCALGLGFMVFGVSSEYATRALVDAPGSLPAGVAIAWLSSWVQFPTIMLVLYLLLLFPNGHPPSPRWRGVVWLVTALIAVGTLSSALRSGPLLTGPTGTVLPVDNPLAVEAIAPLLEGLDAVWPVALVALLLAAIGSVILRFRRARGDERQQLKWFAFASCFVPVVIASNIALRPLPEDVRAPIQAAIFGTAMVLFPVVVGIAVLRYRLYDIDLLINRTLVYGALSAALAATYFGAVALLQIALRPLTGESELAVAGSTLAVVALAAPLRRRIQGTVDRRFYRSRYDAARTLDAFGARLRDEVDLDSVRVDLLDVVHDTMRPAHASVWLRERS